jgi:hypothetical protein
MSSLFRSSGLEIRMFARISWEVLGSLLLEVVRMTYLASISYGAVLSGSTPWYVSKVIAASNSSGTPQSRAGSGFSRMPSVQS